MTNSMISVLIPARGRLEHLRNSLESIVSLADQPKQIELLVRLDEDDLTAGEQKKAVEWYSDVQQTVIVGPRWGYWRMHDYYNQLASVAKGNWLFVWNDDAEILTPGWDEMLRFGPEFSIQQLRRDTITTSDYTFPVVSRDIYTALGHLSHNAHVDSWLADVALAAHVLVLRDDIVFKHCCLPAQERTSKADPGLNEKGWAEYKSEEQQKLVDDDIRKLKQLLSDRRL